jgi:type IV secretory pathway VirJ component
MSTGRRRTASILLTAMLLGAGFGRPAGAAAKPGRKHAGKGKQAPASAAAGASETLTYGRFGQVALYRKTPHPGSVALFYSGDGGWNLGVVDMAETLANMDALVVGINLPRYVKALEASQEKCSYPASDAELLSKYVQKKLGFPTYTPPVLVGYSSGATLVYALLVQAPPNTFKGAISMGFCPDLPLTKPLCAGHGLTWGPGPKGKGFSFRPASTLEQPWIAFQGLVDQVCSPQDVEAYVRQVKNGEAVMLPKVGHGFSVPANWERQFKQAFQRLTSAVEPGHAPAAAAARGAAPGTAPGAAPGAAPGGTPAPGAARGGAPPAPPAAPAPGGGGRAPAPHPATAPAGPAAALLPAAPLQAAVPPVDDLPLVEVPARQPSGDLLAVIVSGDGGWASIDREVAEDLARHGVPVVGLNSLQYFWNARTPEGAAADLQRIARHYLAAWGRRELLLVGYSLGADVLPFMANRLPPDLLGRVRLVVLLGPGRRTSFEFHLSDWLGSGAGDRPVLPEVQKLRGKPLLCLYGQAETDSLCPEIDGLGKAVSFQGSHHFGGDYASLAERILHEVQPAAAGK